MVSKNRPHKVIPIQQGLKQKYTDAETESEAGRPHKVIPIQQGLKRKDCYYTRQSTVPHKVIPIQQGLKLYKGVKRGYKVISPHKVIPIQQGLKHSENHMDIQDTIILIRSFQYNKD